MAEAIANRGAVANPRCKLATKGYSVMLKPSCEVCALSLESAAFSLMASPTPCMWISLETLGAAYVGGQVTEKGKTHEMAHSRLITTVLIAEY